MRFALILASVSLEVLAVPATAWDRGTTPTFLSACYAVVRVGEYRAIKEPWAWCTEPFALWIYQGSNGVPGLQRADEVKDDAWGGICGPGDTIVL